MEVHLRIFFLCFLCFFFFCFCFLLFWGHFIRQTWTHFLTRASQFLFKMYYFYLLKIYLWLLFILIFLQHLFTLSHRCRLRQIKVHNYVELFLFKLFASDGSHLRTGGDTPVVGRAHALLPNIYQANLASLWILPSCRVFYPLPLFPLSTERLKCHDWWRDLLTGSYWSIDPWWSIHLRHKYGSICMHV